MNLDLKDDLQRIYSERFQNTRSYRDKVWKIICPHFFEKMIPKDSVVLDLGCGYGEFINNLDTRKKYGMDLNPDSRKFLIEAVEFLEQDCSKPWKLGDASLDVVFTSNFFEHLPHKQALSDTLAHVHRCLKPGGKIIALGPNIRCLAGQYWDFWDHHIALTEHALSECLSTRGFEVLRVVPRFLPYTMERRMQLPQFFVWMYLKMPVFWWFFGKQFLVVASKKQDNLVSF